MNNYIVYSSAISLYEFYEQQSGHKYNRTCIDGRITSCGNCVGYCQYKEHSGFLTAEQRKKHNCIGKACDYYVAKTKRGLGCNVSCVEQITDLMFVYK